MKRLHLPALPSPQYIHLDIDTKLNHIIPPSPLPYLPSWLSHFLGYRRKEQGPDVGSILIAFWALLGTFCGLLSVGAWMRYTPWISEMAPPVLIASLGAAAVLDYNTVYSPLAMPRNSIFGHTLAAFIGVCFAKLMLLSPQPPDEISYLVAPLACGVASAIMTLANSIYPPGGATAILAVADPQVRKLGWWLVLLVVLASLVMLGVALIINNCQRRYPLWWWSPNKTGMVYKRSQRKLDDIENLKRDKSKEMESDASIRHVEDADESSSGYEDAIVLRPNGSLDVPDWIELDDAERLALAGLLEKLQKPDHGKSVTEKSWNGDGEPP